MIIVFGGKKGGTGKSTIATNIAVGLTNRQRSVLLIDADPQGTSWEFSQTRVENDQLSTITAIKASGNIKKTILDFKDKFDDIIVDTHGGDSTEQRTANLVADIFIMPVRPSYADVASLAKQFESFEALKDLNEKLKLLCILTQCPTNTRKIDQKDTEIVLKDFPYIKIMESYTSFYKVYWKALEEGMGVSEHSKKHKAGLEIDKLIEEIS